MLSISQQEPGLPASENTALLESGAVVPPMLFAEAAQGIQAAALGIDAVANTWQGGATGNWSTAASWSLGHVPTQSETAVIATGTTVTISANTTIYHLECAGIFSARTCGNQLWKSSRYKRG